MRNNLNKTQELLILILNLNNIAMRANRLCIGLFMNSNVTVNAKFLSPVVDSSGQADDGLPSDGRRPSGRWSLQPGDRISICCYIAFKQLESFFLQALIQF